MYIVKGMIVMQLDPSQVSRFYEIWFPLLRFVNSQRKLLNDSRLKGAWNPADAAILRDALWTDDKLLDSFVQRNPANLSEDDLGIVRSWRRRVAGTFLIVKHLKKYSVFVSNDTADSGQSKVYGVLGLSSPLDETMFELPCMVDTVLIPFEGRITYDSLFTSYPIVFGKNIRGTLNRDYQDAKKRGAIIESLERAEMALAGR